MKKGYWKNRFVKKATAGLLALALLVSSAGFSQTEANAAEEGTVVTVAGSTYIEKLAIDDYKTNATAPKPVKKEYKNWLFAGWYTDAACKTEVDSTVQSGTYYAKYVPEDVLSVKCQVSNDTSATAGTSNLRMVSTVDSAAYNKVGFKVEVNGYSAEEYETKTVYKKIVASDESGVSYDYDPTIFQGMSKYFMTITLTQIPSSAFSNGIHVTPYWETLDGTKVYGVERYVRVADNYENVVNVPVRLYSDTTGEMGNVTVDYDAAEYSYTSCDYVGDYDSASVAVTDDESGMVTCAVNSAVSNPNGMLVNLRFTKLDTTTSISIDDFKISGETADWNASCEAYTSMQLANTDGAFPADVLYEYGTPKYNNVEPAATTGTATETMSESGDGVTYSFTAGAAIKVVRVENLQLNTDIFSKMTVRLRSLDGGSFSRYRLFFLGKDAEGNTSGGLTGSSYVIDTGSSLTTTGETSDKNDTLVTVSSADSNGWITVNIDLTGLSAWTDAEVIKGFGFGYVCSTGTQQEIAEIQFLKTDGEFSAETLSDIGRPVIENKLSTNPKEELSVDESGNTTVKYNFEGYGTGSALKTVYVQNLALNPDEFSTMTIHLRSTSTDKAEELIDFTRLRLYLLTDIGGSLTSSPVIDTGETYGNRGTDVTAESDGDKNTEQIVTTWMDADGRITVMVDVSGLDAWTNASEIKGFSFGYVNTGIWQEIEDIQFTKTDGDFSAGALYALGKAAHNKNWTGTTGTDTLVTDSTGNVTGVKHTYASSYSASALKSLYVSNIDLNPAQYDTMTIRLRSVSTQSNGNRTEFSLYRPYFLADTDDADSMTKVFESDITDDTEQVTVSAPDANGWITVTIDLSSIDTWTSAGVIKGFGFGYVNTGAEQEFAEVQFTKENGDFSADVLYAAGRSVFNKKTVVVADEALSQDASGNHILTYDFANVTDTTGETDKLGDETALKSVYVDDISLRPAKYDTMTIWIRDVDGTTFDRWQLFLETDLGGELAGENPAIDTDVVTNYCTDVTDGNGVTWKKVTFNLNSVTDWTSAGVIKGFCFGYGNSGSTQEIKNIQFSATQNIQIIYTSNDYMSQRYAYRLTTEVDELASATCVTAAKASSSAMQIAVTEDESLEDGTATISVTDKKVTCTVDSYYGFEAVVDYFNANGCLLRDGFTTTVNYLDSLSGTEKATQYAYNKSGDYRFMSYNVLWNASYYENDVLVTLEQDEERGALQAEVIEQYMPDVIGLQERNSTRDEIATNLSALGYKEVSVTVNNSTKVNCTPLFYNTSTMTPVSGKQGYLNYENQYDGGDSNDQASKSLTWCIFKTTSGDYIMAVSTHLCTQSGEVRKLQVAEAIALIDSQLTGTYADIPVVVCGDLNSVIANSSSTDWTYGYNDFIDGGYTDATLSASEFTTNIRSYTTYPEYRTFSSAIAGLSGIMHVKDESKIYWDADTKGVDHILFKNLPNSTVYGVVVDDCTRSASDHFPVFVDFNTTNSGTTETNTLTLSASDLYTYANAYWNRTTTTALTGTTTLATDGSSLSYSFANVTNASTSAALRGLYVDLSSIATQLPQYSTMEFSIKLDSGNSLSTCRLYFGANSGTTALKATKYGQIGSGITVGTQDSDGWIKVTVDLSDLTNDGTTTWSSATSIDNIYIGHVPATKGTEQAISAITFSK